MKNSGTAEEIKEILADVKLSKEDIKLKNADSSSGNEFSCNALFAFLQKLKSDPRIKTAEISGDGFINFSLAADFWHDCLRDILSGTWKPDEVKPLTPKELASVQKAYNRAVSVLKHGKRMFGDVSYPKADLRLLQSEEEIKLIRKMTSSPLSLADIAEQFSELWEAERGEVEMRFLSAREKEVSLSRLALIYALSLVITGGFSILDITVN